MKRLLRCVAVATLICSALGIPVATIVVVSVVGGGDGACSIGGGSMSRYLVVTAAMTLVFFVLAFILWIFDPLTKRERTCVTVVGGVGTAALQICWTILGLVFSYGVSDRCNEILLGTCRAWTWINIAAVSSWTIAGLYYIVRRNCQ